MQVAAIGPTGAASSKVVPDGLLDALHALDARFDQRENALALEQERLMRDRALFEEQAAAREWEIQQQQHRLSVSQESFAASQSEAGHVSSYQQGTLVIVADGGQFSTTMATLCAHEPTSGLATAARNVFTAATAHDGAVTAVRLYIDRDAAATQRIVDWLRRGASSLTDLPRPVLKQLGVEAEYWKLTSLSAQVLECLGKHDAASEGASELEWMIGELHRGRNIPAVCRAALEHLQQWLAAGRARRQLALRRGENEVLSSILDTMEAHAADPPLIAAGLGSCVLLGAEAGGRTGTRMHRIRLERIVVLARRLASTTEASAAEDESIEAALPAKAEGAAKCASVSGWQPMTAQEAPIARADADAGTGDVEGAEPVASVGAGPPMPARSSNAPESAVGAQLSVAAELSVVAELSAAAEPAAVAASGASVEAAPASAPQAELLGAPQNVAALVSDVAGNVSKASGAALHGAVTAGEVALGGVTNLGQAAADGIDGVGSMVLPGIVVASKVQATAAGSVRALGRGAGLAEPVGASEHSGPGADPDAVRGEAASQPSALAQTCFAAVDAPRPLWAAALSIGERRHLARRLLAESAKVQRILKLL